MQDQQAQDKANFDIKKVQEALSKFTQHRLHIDGIFGRATLNAMNDFQKSQNLPVTETLDLRTYEALVSQASKIQHWILKINDTTWPIDQFKAGEKAHFNANHHHGERQNDYKYFTEVRRGDLMLAYAYDRTNAVVCVFEVEQSLHEDSSGERIELSIREVMSSPIAYPLSPALALTAEQLSSHIHEKLFLITQEVYESILRVPSKKSIEDEKSLIANYNFDAPAGDDYLSVTKDVKAFAKIMASTRLNPPLAIALFGKWGSGKSFFMNQMRNWIKYYSDNEKNETNPNYKKGIAQIHFNAWSYLDANLWASLVTKIFEGLNEYISKDSASDLEKKAIAEALNQKLTITKDEMGVLKTQKSLVIEQIVSLEEQQKNLNTEIQTKIEEIAQNTVSKALSTADAQFNITEKIEEALGSNKTFVKTKEELRQIIPEEYWRNPKMAYEELKSKQTFLKEFFRPGEIRNNMIWLILTLVIILLIPLLLSIGLPSLQRINFTIPQVGLSILLAARGVWNRAEITYKKLQPLIASFWNLKQDYELAMSNAIAEHEQKEKALKIQIEKGKSELASVSQQIQQANVIKADLEFKINNALSTEALYTFIEKRNRSDDYKKHLGIISIIRQDFETLNDLFMGHNVENRKIQDSKEFKEKFKVPLERIVLYIDDLDRCPEERVVEVLEAVNLLMAFPLFVVVVGVDPRWVKNALIKKYYLQFAGKSQAEAVQAGLEIIEPAHYLEKIFQVPFHLKEASDTDVKVMLTKLVGQNVAKPTTKNSNVIGGSAKYNPQADQPLPKQEGAQVPQIVNPNNSGAAPEQEAFEQLLLEPIEITLLASFSKIIGTNPRAIKRFVNIYQIARAHDDFRAIPKQSDEGYVMLMLSLAIINLKNQDIAKILIDTLEMNAMSTLREFLSENEALNRESLGIFKELADEMKKSEEMKDLLPIRMGLFIPYIALVERFSFAISQ